MLVSGSSHTRVLGYRGASCPVETKVKMLQPLLGTSLYQNGEEIDMKFKIKGKNIPGTKIPSLEE